MTRIVSGFPGVGKSYYKENSIYYILDSDSSKFSWIEKGVRHPNFPQNYIDHIISFVRNTQEGVEIILVSSHTIVRNALVENNLDFILVYPERDLKKEYLERFKKRGNDQGFIDMIDKNWDTFIDEMESQERCSTIPLRSGEYLTDVEKYFLTRNLRNY